MAATKGEAFFDVPVRMGQIAKSISPKLSESEVKEKLEALKKGFDMHCQWVTPGTKSYDATKKSEDVSIAKSDVCAAIGIAYQNIAPQYREWLDGFVRTKVQNNAAATNDIVLNPYWAHLPELAIANLPQSFWLALLEDVSFRAMLRIQAHEAGVGGIANTTYATLAKGFWSQAKIDKEAVLNALVSTDSSARKLLVRKDVYGLMLAAMPELILKLNGTQNLYTIDTLKLLSKQSVAHPEDILGEPSRSKIAKVRAYVDKHNQQSPDHLKTVDGELPVHLQNTYTNACQQFHNNPASQQLAEEKVARENKINTEALRKVLAYPEVRQLLIEDTATTMDILDRNSSPIIRTFYESAKATDKVGQSFAIQFIAGLVKKDDARSFVSELFDGYFRKEKLRHTRNAAITMLRIFADANKNPDDASRFLAQYYLVDIYHDANQTQASGPLQAYPYLSALQEAGNHLTSDQHEQVLMFQSLRYKKQPKVYREISGKHLPHVEEFARGLFTAQSIPNQQSITSGRRILENIKSALQQEYSSNRNTKHAFYLFGIKNKKLTTEKLKLVNTVTKGIDETLAKIDQCETPEEVEGWLLEAKRLLTYAQSINHQLYEQHGRSRDGEGQLGGILAAQQAKLDQFKLDGNEEQAPQAAAPSM